MSLTLDFARELQGATPTDAWKLIADHALDIFSEPLDEANPVRDMNRRESLLGDVDLFLATAGWDLWRDFHSVFFRNADSLAEWWAKQDGGCAILVLDALSLRELPWLMTNVAERGYKVHEHGVRGSEIPPETTPFAKALGFASRSSLYNNQAGSSHRLPGARTESLECAWEDAASQITSDPRWLLWHAWPDNRVHDLAKHGKGLQELISEVQQELNSDGFWLLIEKLTQGRRLLITSDHGYAASGLFPDINDKDQISHLKEHFKAGRSAPDDGKASPWIPPIDLVLDGHHGRHRHVLGRRKWKVSGGHPTLSHGGLTVLEVLVPFLEISRTENQ